MLLWYFCMKKAKLEAAKKSIIILYLNMYVPFLITNIKPRKKRYKLKNKYNFYILCSVWHRKRQRIAKDFLLRHVFVGLKDRLHIKMERNILNFFVNTPFYCPFYCIFTNFKSVDIYVPLRKGMRIVNYKVY